MRVTHGEVDRLRSSIGDDGVGPYCAHRLLDEIEALWREREEMQERHADDIYYAIREYGERNE